MEDKEKESKKKYTEDEVIKEIQVDIEQPEENNALIDIRMCDIISW